MPDSVTPWTIAHQAPLSMELSRWEYWVDCHFLLMRSSQPRDQTWVSCIAGRPFTRAGREAGHARTVVFRMGDQEGISQQVSGWHLLYSTWNSAQLLRGRLDVRGVWGRMDTHAHICVWPSLFAAYLKLLELC